MSLNLKKKTGPLYWCTYEYQVTHNLYIPEERWKKNIDWLAEKFRPFGYEMVCTDGWIEDCTVINENGYICAQHNSWKHDWKYWADYCESKGLSLGVYYNPLWISPKAVETPGVKVVGTDIPVREVTDLDYTFDGNNYGIGGDRFSYANGESALYWVDVNRPGAKEYVQGYVKFFIDAGVKFLRVDFLSWYEDGIDKGVRIGRDHGAKNYRLALQWMKEAAGDEIMLSLVMPHLKEEGENEYGMGAMARINEDCGEGGWKHFSAANRGKRFPWWSQFTNTFDGLIYWSHPFAQKGMIADADMLRLHTFANDEEKKTAVSLCVISGAPVDMADQYDTIDGNEWIYTNTELLELNRQEMVGLPLSSDPLNPASQIWTGKLNENTYVLAFFNREDTEQTREADFTELFSQKGGSVRDLWEHCDLGAMDGVKEILQPHACKVYKITF